MVVPGQLRYILGTDRASDGAGLIANPNTTVLIDQLVNADLCAQSLFDWHVSPAPGGPSPQDQDPYAIKSMNLLLLSRGCEAARVALLEENWCNNNLPRALADAVSSNALQTLPDIVTLRTTSQCWSAAGHAEGCTEGHVLIGPQGYVAAQAPALVQRMIAETHRPQVAPVVVTIEDHGWDGNLSAFAAWDPDGLPQPSLVIRIINPSNASVTAVLNVSSLDSGFHVQDGTQFELRRLTSPLVGSEAFNWSEPETTGFNSLLNPDLISEEQSWIPYVPLAPIQLPSYSFSVLVLPLSLSAGPTGLLTPRKMA